MIIELESKCRKWKKEQNRFEKKLRSKSLMLQKLFVRQLGPVKVDLILSISLCSPEKVRTLNQRFRGKDKTTDVLSFPLHKMVDFKTWRDGPVLLGDIFIDLHLAVKASIINEISVEEELLRLTIHGLCHLLGYDHEVGAKKAAQMRKLEQKMVDLFEIPITV